MRGIVVAGCFLIAAAACGEEYGEDGATPLPNDDAGSSDGSTEAGPATCETTKCGAHETCRMENGAPLCACVTSYAKKDGACAWVDPIRDPGFTKMPADGWTLSGMAVIEPAAMAPKSPGRLTLSCDASTRAQQTIAMPAYQDAEPLAFEVSTITGELDFDTLLGVNGRYRELFFRDTGRVCAGENAFGGDVAISFIPNCRAYGVTQPIDHVALVPAPECPAIGTVLNGAFEDNGGWKATGAGAEIAAGAGTNASRAGHLSIQSICEASSLVGTASYPGKSISNAALEMTVKGTNGAELLVSLGNFGTAAGILGSLVGTGIYEKVRLCAPQYARGIAMPLRFDMKDRTTGTPCNGSAVPKKEFFIDDLVFVSDPACADPGWVVDGGFEGTDPRRSWIFSGEGSATLTSSSYQPHSGAKSALLSGCGNPRLAQYATIPDAAPGAGGAQVRFWYRALGANMSFEGPSGVLPLANVWTQKTYCVSPWNSTSGLSTEIAFRYGPTGACSSPELFIDDVEVVRDPSCPEK